MKDISELNPHKFKTNDAIDKNLGVLFSRLMELQLLLDKELVITSGLRSDEFQAELIAAGKTNSVHSKHISGNAADLEDKNHEISNFLINNPDRLVSIGFWMETPASCPTWVHLQTIPPMSGKRIFIP